MNPEPLEEFPPVNRATAFIAVVVVAVAALVSSFLPLGWAA